MYWSPSVTHSDPLNSGISVTEVLHPLQSGAPHSSFGMCLDMTQQSFSPQTAASRYSWSASHDKLELRTSTV